MADDSSDDSESTREDKSTKLPPSSDLSEQLDKLMISFHNPEDRDATLSTLQRIFIDITENPNDDKYRQIKLTNKTFNNKVWRYPAGKELMKMSGWVVKDDRVRLRDDSCVKTVCNLLILKEARLNIMQSLQCSPNMPSTILDKGTTADTDDTSSNHFTFSDEIVPDIVQAITSGQGTKFKEMIKPYDPYFIQNVRVLSLSLIDIAFAARQIGIARILVREYGVDANSLNEEGCPSFIKLFKGCDSTESCQALIVEFIKEFEVDVEKYKYDLTALHHAVLNKLFTVVKFLVENCKVNVNCTSVDIIGGTALHMAYGIGEKNIAQYLIEHGAEQNAIDDNGSKPKDYELYGDPDNPYSLFSKFLCKERVIYRSFLGTEHFYYGQLRARGLAINEAIDRTFKNFPSLQKILDGGVNQRNLELTPTLNELNRYITDMAPSYYNIGLELDIVNSQLKLIKNDPSLPDLRAKCCKMLEVWLENDTSATWKKLCDTLQEVELSVLAERIKSSQ